MTAFESADTENELHAAGILLCGWLLNEAEMQHRFTPLFLLSLACLVSRVSAKPQRSIVVLNPEIQGPEGQLADLIDDQQRVALRGNMHPLARKENDMGHAAPEHRMEKMILLLRLDDERQKALDALAKAQQDPNSPLYHHWLTPQSYATHFGVPEKNRSRVVEWLRSHGLEVDATIPGGRVILFSGSVAQVEETFHTRIDAYVSNHELHFANATDPEIPAALSDVVDGVVSMHDFRLKARRPDSLIQAARQTVTPADFSAIYNLIPLYTSGIDGAGMSIAVVGRTRTDLSDIRLFRSSFGLPANEPDTLIAGSDPGRLGTDEEAVTAADLEWAGAVAPRAFVKLVASSSTSATDGVFLAAKYVVDQNLAPVMSVHFGLCEAELGTAANHYLNALWEQATVQGISVVAPSGSGGDECAGDTGSKTGGSTGVSGLSSTAHDLSVGGTEQDDAKGSRAEAESFIRASRPSGTCAKPWWQSEEGVRDDLRRDVPELTLASGERDAYPVFVNGLAQLTDGNSIASAALAGIMALVVQSTGSRQGNPAAMLSWLANSQRLDGESTIFRNLANTNSRPTWATEQGGGTAAYGSANRVGLVDASAQVTAWNRAGSGSGQPQSKNSGERARTGSIAELVEPRSNLAVAASSAAPVLFYSDIDSGPATGGDNGVDGALVCVYGQYFGNTRQTSRITVGGVAMASYVFWRDPGPPYRPGYYAKACGRISRGTPAGPENLQVTTPHGTSGALPFTVRPGKIYFVALTGNDKTGNGSSQQPWLTIQRCKSAMAAGDICYVRGGVVSTDETDGVALLLNSSGAPGYPKAIVAYPGETVMIDNHGTGTGHAAILSSLNGGQNATDWTLAGLTINGGGIAVQLLPMDRVRLVDSDILCEGPYCYGANGGLVVGHPVAISANVAVLGNRIHDVGCHEDEDYIHSASPCAWVNAGSSQMSSVGTRWKITLAASGFSSGDVIEVNGQLRKVVSCDTPYCLSGILDAAFMPDVTAGAFQFRLAVPTKLYHSVYFGNTNSVQFAWNDVDGSRGQACRGLQFHSTNGHNEYDLHVYSNAIHDTVCDCLNFATVDPGQGTVEAFNNVLYHCGTANPTITNSGYSAIYSSNDNDDYAETMTRKGNIQVYNNTIYDAGSGSGGAIYATNPGRSCFAVGVSGGSTSTFPHAKLAAALSSGNNVLAEITGLCGYGTTCTGTQQPIPFLAGQMAVLDTAANLEEVRVVSVPDATHVVIAAVRGAHAAGATLTAANGNTGIVATNNICVQPGVNGTSYAALFGVDEVGRAAATYLSGSNNDCYGLIGSCPAQLTNSVNTLPAFLSLSLQNFRLQTATPLSEEGTSNESPLTDQDGHPRPPKPTPGAFEVLQSSAR
jgi:hypothetical protein